jgi:DNA-binding transcriptional ArsR family regulator
VPTTSSRARPASPALAEIAETFDALAHEARREIVMLLVHHGPELPSGYLASRLRHSWPTTTRHLHVLEAAGVVTVRRDGRQIIYRLEPQHIQRVIGGWLSLLDATRHGEIWRSPNPRTTKRKTST